MSENSSEYLKRTCLICGCHTNQTINIYEPRGGPNIVQLIQAKFKFQVNILKKYTSVYVYSIDFFKMSNISHRTVYRRLLIVRDFKLFFNNIYLMSVCGNESPWFLFVVSTSSCVANREQGWLTFRLKNTTLTQLTTHPLIRPSTTHQPKKQQPQLSTRQHPCRLTLCRCCHDIRVSLWDEKEAESGKGK